MDDAVAAVDGVVDIVVDGIVDVAVLAAGLGVILSSALGDSCATPDGFLRDDAFPYVVNLRLDIMVARSLFFSTPGRSM